MADTKEKTPLDILRDERSKFEARVEKQIDAIFHQFQDTLKTAKDLYDGLINECKVEHSKVSATPGLDEFIKPFLPTRTPRSASTGAKRVKSDILYPAIISALTDWTTHADLQKSKAIVDLYAAVGKPVPSLQAALLSLIEEKKIEKKGERFDAKYKVK